MSEDRVRVEVSRSGGFAGVTRTASVDTDSLDTAQAAELRRLVGASRAASVPPARRPSADGADRFQYEITVEHGGQTDRAVCGEPDLTPEEQELVRWVLSGGAPRPA
jgi:hypothetical protein